MIFKIILHTSGSLREKLSEVFPRSPDGALKGD